MKTYYDVIQLTEANDIPCEQIGVRYGEKIVVLRNLDDALTFLYCEKFFLKYSTKWVSLQEPGRVESSKERLREISKVIVLMEKELKRKDFIHIEKLLLDVADERNWVYSIELYESILRLDDRYAS